MDNLQDIKETDKKVKTESKTMKVEDNPKPTDNMWYLYKTTSATKVNITNSSPVYSNIKKHLQLKTVKVGNITVAQLLLLYKSKKLSGDSNV